MRVEKIGMVDQSSKTVWRKRKGFQIVANFSGKYTDGGLRGYAGSHI